MDIYGISKSFVYTCAYRVTDAIHACEALEIRFPETEAELSALDLGWRAASPCRGAIWRGQVAAVDGIHFTMIRPSVGDVENPLSYHVARKDKYALLCLASVDVNCNFLSYSIERASKTHDSIAHNLSPLGIMVEEGRLPPSYFLNGDAAFSANNQMMTPSASNDDFDYLQSANRVAVERAFGVLVRRWGLLWRPMELQFKKRAQIIGALMKLHNFCNKHRLSQKEYLDINDGDYVEVQPSVFMTAPPMSVYETPRPEMTLKELASLKNQRRSALIEEVVAQGLKRPRNK